MKENTHPEYHDITVTFTNGTSVTMRSTYGKAGDTLRLDIDPFSHPAWNPDMEARQVGGNQMDKFTSKFGGIFGKEKKKDDDKKSA